MPIDTAAATMASLLDAHDEKALAAQLKKVSEDMGFEQFAVGIEINLPMLGRIRHVTNGYSPAWQRTYNERNYIAIDPTIRHCREQDAPLIWAESLGGHDTTEFWAQARSHGIANGLSVPVHGRAGLSSMTSLSRDKPLHPTAHETTRILNRARVLASCAHVATIRIVAPGLLKQHKPQLSQREIECMRWVAHGKTSSEIAKKLCLAEATVSYHLNKAIRKLGAKNRAHAIALSVALALVD